MKSSIIKLACGALLLTITFTACTTAQAETAVTPTPTPAPTISPKVLKEQATVQEIRNSTVEVFTNGQQSATVIFLARGANEIESVTPRPIAYEELLNRLLKSEPLRFRQR